MDKELYKGLSPVEAEAAEILVQLINTNKTYEEFSKAIRATIAQANALKECLELFGGIEALERMAQIYYFF